MSIIRCNATQWKAQTTSKLGNVSFTLWMAVFGFMILQTAHWPKLDFEMNEIQQSKEKPNKQMFRTWRSALWVPCLSCDCSSWWSFGSVFCPAGSFATATAATAGTRFAPVWFFVWFPFYHLPFPLKRTEEKKRRQTLEPLAAFLRQSELEWLDLIILNQVC